VRLVLPGRWLRPNRRLTPLVPADQAKEMEIFDVNTFLRSKLFVANGYKYKSNEKQIEKVFTRVNPDEA
jgi:hypothetical protein